MFSTDTLLAGVTRPCHAIQQCVVWHVVCRCGSYGCCGSDRRHTDV